MGGRGAKRRQDTVTETTVTGSLTIGTETLEFEGKLKYYKDAAMTREQRQSTDTFEKKRIKNKIEYAVAFRPDGTAEDGEKRGGSGSVRVPRRWAQTGNVRIHTHPREDGVMGGTFSAGDIEGFVHNPNTVFRAAAKEGTYSITGTKDIDGKGLVAYAKKLDKQFAVARDKAYDKAVKAINAGGDYDTIVRQYHRELNTAFVQKHDGFKKGEKTYGYEYTLERLK